MSHCAYTQYIAVGDAAQLNELHDLMLHLASSSKNPNDLSDLLEALGGDKSNIRCRGEWFDLFLSNGKLSFNVETPWDEPDEVRHLIEKKLPDLKLYYITEEPTCDIFTTNDTNGEYFPERYYLWIEDADTEYYRTFEDVRKAVEEVTGFDNLDTFVACCDALEDYCEATGLSGHLAEFEILP